MSALQAFLTRQEYLRAAGALELRAPCLDRSGHAKAAQLSRGLAYILRQRAAGLQLRKAA